MNFSEQLLKDRWPTEWKIAFAMIRVFGMVVRTERQHVPKSWDKILNMEFTQFEEKEIIGSDEESKYTEI